MTVASGGRGRRTRRDTSVVQSAVPMAVVRVRVGVVRHCQGVFDRLENGCLSGQRRSESGQVERDEDTRDAEMAVGDNQLPWLALSAARSISTQELLAALSRTSSVLCPDELQRDRFRSPPPYKNNCRCYVQAYMLARSRLRTRAAGTVGNVGSLHRSRDQCDQTWS